MATALLSFLIIKRMALKKPEFHRLEDIYI
jgi:hypothetical protein